MNGKELKELTDALGISQKKLAELFRRYASDNQRDYYGERCSHIYRRKNCKPLQVCLLVTFFKEGHNAVASGNGSVAVAGNNNVAGNGDIAVLQERITMLERLIEEKERTIKMMDK